jgi:CRP-like cAMP-binding protein
MPANQRVISLSSLRLKIALFHCLESADFQLIEKRLVRRRYPGGQVLFHMGDEGGSFHIIVRVRVKVTIPSSSGEELILAILFSISPHAWRRRYSISETPSFLLRPLRSPHCSQETYKVKYIKKK